MNSIKTDPPTSPHRIDGRLHLVQHLRDDQGNVIATRAEPLKVEFHLEDLGQLVAGACVMALPVALTGEVWDLGRELTVGRTLMILAFSFLTMAAFVWSLFYGKRLIKYRGQFLLRVCSAYLLTFLVSLLLLILFDRAPLDDLRLTLTRTVIVAFPASFAATAVDFIR